MRSSRFTIVSTLVLSLALIFTLNLVAVGGSVNSDVSVTVNQGMSLSIDETFHNFGSVGTSAIETGFVETDGDGGGSYGNVLTVQSNTDWEVNVKTTDSNLGTNGDYTKPLGDFKFKASEISDTAGKISPQISSYTAITDTDQVLATGSAGGNLEIGMDYKIMLDYEDVGGTSYSVTLTYTLATP